MHCTSEPQVEAAIDVRKVLTSHYKNHALTAHFQHCMYIHMCICILHVGKGFLHSLNAYVHLIYSRLLRLLQ